jgi:hypothetical protein
MVDPLVTCQVVAETLGGGGDWERVTRAELTELVAEANAHIPLRPTHDYPEGWKWSVGGSLLVWQDYLAGRPLSVTRLTLTIRSVVAVHHWHLRNEGVDAFAEVRARWLWAHARLLAATVPQPWERELLGQPNGQPVRAGPGLVLRNQLAHYHLTEAEVAARVGVSPSTMSRWAAGTRRPSAEHRQALARELGGQAGDY